MTFKLGKLPGLIPAGLRELGFYAAGRLPAAPASVEPPRVTPDPDGTPWGVLGNDQWGDCGVAGLTHGFMCDASITGEAEQFPDAAANISYYLGYTGGDDTGVVLSAFLRYVKQHGFSGHSVSAYAPVGVHDIPTLQFAVNAYGFAYTGITVTQNMMDAFDAGDAWVQADTRGEVLGGHCVPVVGYDSTYLYVVTWGQLQAVAYPAWHHASDEAWAVITGEFVTRNGDGRGVSLAALQADLSKVAR